RPAADYDTLNAALADLRKKNIIDVSLCLLPGDHEIKERIDLTDEPFFRTIEISGSGAYISMKTDLIKLTASKIILLGLTLSSTKGGDGTPKAQIHLKALEELIIDHCNFSKDRPNGAMEPFIFIDTVATLYLKNSKVISINPLVLANGVQGVI